MATHFGYVNGETFRKGYNFSMYAKLILCILYLKYFTSRMFGE